MNKNIELQKKARKRIPGATQLLSKRPEMFAPGIWPGYFTKAKGVETWDLDDNKYLDMSISGIGANVLGFADDDVDDAVKKAIDNGNSCSLNCPEEIELADLLCRIHPWAQMARYCRSGGESMAVAVRIARAYTKRDKVAFCGYHGWHDWYLAANLTEEEALSDHLLPGLSPHGVPRGLKGTAIPFRYNDINGLKTVLNENNNEIAAIVMEPLRNDPPLSGFLEEVRNLADENGSVMIFDEITAAFRMNSGGAHLNFKVEPDIAVFAKAISNGYPMGVILGRENIMQSAQSSFISSTYWTERIGPTAALATIKKHNRLNVANHLMKIGEKVQQLWQKQAENCDLNIHIGGIPPLSHFSFEYPNGQAMMTLFVQLMIDKNILASNRFYASFAHTDQHLQIYQSALESIFEQIKQANEQNAVEKLLKGEIAHTGFKRLA